MDPITAGMVGTAVLLLAIFFLRIPVGFAMGIIGFVGFAYVLNWQAATGMLGTELWDVFSNYGLTVIPLFILMGQICFYSGVNERLYRSAYAWMGEVRGGLAMTTILACAGFSAICGSNSATAATMSTVALPEMKKFKYSPVLSTGSVAAGATLGVVIPPSVVLIIIGLQTSQSIAQLFLGGMVPGILLTLLFMATIWYLCRRHPAWGPAGPKTTLADKLRSLPGSIEMVVIFLMVMGGLFLGLFTPTEAGAAGAGMALILATATGRMSLDKFRMAVNDTLKISCMIMVIILGAVIFGRFLTITRMPFEAAAWVAGLPIPPMVIILVICLIYVVGGMVMDALALLLVTIPIFFPVVTAMGYDPLWFGVLITVVTSLGAITPPVGVNMFIVASMAKNVPMTDVFKGVSYFIVAYCVCIALIMAFPQLVTFAPGLIR
ncbi:MAG: TRAP transporter large permease [Pseudodesulfovibrio sp.]|uniref:TRAP dicarboxylate transporter, DctM subunit n=1 Tax=Pseudodesulfovibrio aespoeensis (strain ATCC 700646 / DSM 10631 / Aspo-2) TaxID=643562 RepID=E6VYR6_PSEA9|nr:MULTISPECIES: TRAP transporter large permease [Pseudodesulfovibrio]MBU4379936.1 TRAP transporter large permease [Pseudomonadota bacterium]ADU63933.1 TRAP dicarboxylate transporter, DctM subunit [Pseudodesulfovibrio aespoeensis Aspo-2]MBU4474397.1 TRAP transporter large permease [Pseudomonadota bacterium]MBU4517042.1 TRAP transporter large permease [Pseudomonadota bacterium]MBU4523293.1 TRAP transporter large permease [Pseudomonadota bacterium]